MKVEIRELTDQKADLVIEGTNHATLNMIRRELIGNTPKLAIEDVTIYDNTSALFDEMIAHRLGLMPVPTDLTAFVPREECTCEGEGCPNCTVLYTLSKEGPCTVYSGDLTPTDNAYRIKDEKIPLVKLLEGQRLMLEAAAILGTSRKHAKWAPVQAAGYMEYPKVEIKDEALDPSTYSDLQRTAPEGALEFADGKMRVLDEEKAYLFLRSAVRTFDVDNVELSLVPGKFIFRFETDGSLTARDAFLHAIRDLMDRLKTLEQEAPKLKVEEPESPLA